MFVWFSDNKITNEVPRIVWGNHGTFRAAYPGTPPPTFHYNSLLFISLKTPPVGWKAVEEPVPSRLNIIISTHHSIPINNRGFDKIIFQVCHTRSVVWIFNNNAYALYCTDTYVFHE